MQGVGDRVERANDKGAFRTLHSVSLWEIEQISTSWSMRSVFKTDVVKTLREMLAVAST